MNTSKAVIVLTNFWDANILIDYGFLLYRVEGEDKVYKINIRQGLQEKCNFTVNSIALSNPPLGKLPHLEGITRLDFFCPTYDILHRYKEDNDWIKYTKDYYKILKDRKKDLKDWVDNLEPNRVYFLCCWENTVGGAHCHRDLIYKKLLSSEAAMEKTFPIYRHGEKIYKKERNGAVQISMPTGIVFEATGIIGHALAGTIVTSSGSYVTIVNVNGETVTRIGNE